MSPGKLVGWGWGGGGGVGGGILSLLEQGLQLPAPPKGSWPSAFNAMS